MKVGIVATFKNESDYIIEWVSYHLGIGVDSFILPIIIVQMTQRFYFQTYNLKV